MSDEAIDDPDPRPGQRIFDELGATCWAEVAGMFAAEVEARLREIRAAADKPAELHALIHRLKGSCLTLDLERCSELCKALEQASRNERDCRPLIAELDERCREQGAAIRRFLED